MGFKIDSLSTLSAIANNLSVAASDAIARLDQTSAALDELVSNVTGGGIDTTLNNLKSGLNTTGSTTVNLLNEVSTFISSQASSYTTNEETVINELTQIETALDGVGEFSTLSTSKNAASFAGSNGSNYSSPSSVSSGSYVNKFNNAESVGISSTSGSETTSTTTNGVSGSTGNTSTDGSVIGVGNTSADSSILDTSNTSTDSAGISTHIGGGVSKIASSTGSSSNSLNSSKYSGTEYSGSQSASSVSSRGASSSTANSISDVLSSKNSKKVVPKMSVPSSMSEDNISGNLSVPVLTGGASAVAAGIGAVKLLNKNKDKKQVESLKIDVWDGSVEESYIDENDTTEVLSFEDGYLV